MILAILWKRCQRTPIRSVTVDMNEKIMIVDDEKEIADLLELYLKNDGYDVYKFYKGMDALKCVESEKMDLAILDVMLPDVDGFHICQKIRERYFYPIIMLTAKVEDADKIMGLTIGADDYITKPFNPLEVAARVKTQLRRYVNYNNAESREKKESRLWNLTLTGWSLTGIPINAHCMEKRSH